MAFAPLWIALGAGALAITALVFWAKIQNWLADLLNRTRERLGVAAEPLQSALVVLDRIIVSGQRLVSATLRVLFNSETGEPTTVEESRTLSIDELPAEVRERLEAGQPLTYELSVGSMRVQQGQKNNVTYKLAVRRNE